ncbi:hypothetical protein KW805_01800 [Candidatus Pacearchaeota archaeon]|nr:hypothetical protein [Candidatus Pacearchaeota archaeon]
MKRPIERLGLILVIVGVILLISSYSLTGAVIGAADAQSREVLGLVAVFVGILLLSLGEPYAFRSRNSLRTHNNQAHYHTRKEFVETYGRNPTPQEHREYMRSIHEKNDLHSMVEEKKRHKAA